MSLLIYYDYTGELNYIKGAGIFIITAKKV